jgi:sugar phosphate isomerase/epimerase
MNAPSRNHSHRRKFLRNLLAVPALASAEMISSANPARAAHLAGTKPPALKLSLNAYSFNKQLLDGTMTIDDMLEFCAEQGLMAVDITGYYFKGYPDVPSDEVIFNVKRKAFSLGLEICGTGVRNDFTHADAAKRRESVELVKNWIGVAQKLGGQTVRIFSGTQKPEGYTRPQILEWMIKDIQECVEYGKERGIVVALQNHDDFIKTAEETIEIMEAIKSPWYGLMLDIGSFRTADPYDEIARTIKYAVTWQIKEKVFVEGKETDVDAGRLITLIRNAGFRGYLPLETLGEGDPKQKIPALLGKFRAAMART